MGVTLERLSNQDLASTCRHLCAPDLARVSLVCKRLNAITKPLIWSDIEFHDFGFHESSQQLQVSPPFQPRSPRPYHSTKALGRMPMYTKATKFFVMLHNLQQSDPGRFKEIAARVRSLCTVAEKWQARPPNEELYVNYSMWPLLPYFTNLKSLELHGDCCEDGTDMDLDSLPTPNLRFAKLYGYLPRGVAAWVLRSGPTLERLELGLLNDGETYGDIEELWEEETLIPLPLSRFLPTTDGEGTVDLALPILKHLCLCRPHDGNQRENPEPEAWSLEADRFSIADWRQLLLASSQSLETLVLDNRLGCDDEEDELEVDFIERNYLNNSLALVIGMLETLLVQGELSKLKKVHLYGVAVTDDPKISTVSTSLPAGKLVRRLDSQGIMWEARLGRWCLVTHTSARADWAHWTTEIDSQCQEEDSDDDTPRMTSDAIIASS